MKTINTRTVDKPWLSVTEVIQLTGLSRSTVIRRIADGSLKSFRIGRRVLIATESILKGAA